MLSLPQQLCFESSKDQWLKLEPPFRFVREAVPTVYSPSYHHFDPTFEQLPPGSLIITVALSSLPMFVTCLARGFDALKKVFMRSPASVRVVDIEIFEYYA